MRSQEIQRRHYADTAPSYDMELGQSPEHELALYVLLGIVDSINAESVLDVGSGTGRGLSFLMKNRPDLTIRGIEPVDELREVGYNKGIPRDWLTSGSGYEIPLSGCVL